MYKKVLEKSVWIYLAIGVISLLVFLLFIFCDFLPGLFDKTIDFNDTYEVTATVSAVQEEEIGRTRVFIEIKNEEYIDFQLDHAQEYENFEKIKDLPKGEKITVRMSKDEEMWLEEDNEYMSAVIFSLRTENEELVSFEEYEKNVAWRNAKSYLMYIPVILFLIALLVFVIYRAKNTKIGPKPSRLVK